MVEKVTIVMSEEMLSLANDLCTLGEETWRRDSDDQLSIASLRKTLRAALPANTDIARLEAEVAQLKNRIRRRDKRIAELEAHSAAAFVETCHRIAEEKNILWSQAAGRLIKDWNLAGKEARAMTEIAKLHPNRTHITLHDDKDTQWAYLPIDVAIKLADAIIALAKVE